MSNDTVKTYQDAALVSTHDWAVSMTKALRAIQKGLEITCYRIGKASDDSDVNSAALVWFNDMLAALPEDYKKRWSKALKAYGIKHHPELEFFDVGTIDMVKVKDKPWHMWKDEKPSTGVKQLDMVKECKALEKKLDKQGKLFEEYGDKIYQPVDSVAQQLVRALANGATGAEAIARAQANDQRILDSQAPDTLAELAKAS